jgi:hypothetical protein
MGNNQALTYGSLGEMAQRAGKSIAETFMQADAIVMIDISLSMSERDCGEGTRYDAALAELKKLQRQIPGKVGVIQWSNLARFVPGGVPDFPTGSTDLEACLKFVKPADNTGIRLILISDGEPDNQESALAVAQTFKSKIDTVYVGPANGYGADFLKRLAALTGGQAVTQSVSEIGQLSQTVKKLLAA